MKIVHYYNDTYRRSFYFYIGWTIPQLRKVSTWKHMTFESGVYGKTTWYVDDYSKGVHIWIEDPTDVPSLHHECIHAATLTLDGCGVEPSWKNDEPLTYLSQVIFEAGWKIMKRKLKR